MSVLAERLVATAAALFQALPPGEDLDAALRGGHEQSRLEQLRLAGELRRLADAVGARLAGDLKRRDDFEPGGEPLATRHGERSLADVVARAAGLPYATAEQWCSVGAAVTTRTGLLGDPLPADRPRVGTALDAGELTLEAATMISRALRQLEDSTTLDERDRAEAILVQESSELTLRQLARLCGELRERLDPDGAELREDLLRRRAGIRMVRTRDGGTRWILDLHPEAKGILRAAIDARTAPRRKLGFSDVDDPAVDLATAENRGLRQRRLDELVGIARESLARDDGDLAGLPVSMLVTVSLDALTAGVGSAAIAGVDQPISAATARRLACSANLIPVVLGGKSEVLDVGRSSRLFSRGQRLAMAARDRGCTWPGCEAPPGWWEAAHSRSPWHTGGRTRLDNGALLCTYHHHRLDDDGWEFELRNGIPYFIPPPRVDPARIPRRGRRERLPAELVGERSRRPPFSAGGTGHAAARETVPAPSSRSLSA
jgi:hypothetical protein